MLLSRRAVTFWVGLFYQVAEVFGDLSLDDTYLFRYNKHAVVSAPDETVTEPKPTSRAIGNNKPKATCQANGQRESVTAQPIVLAR